MQRTRLGAIALGATALLGATLASPALAATDSEIPTFQEFQSSSYKDADQQYEQHPADHGTASRAQHARDCPPRATGSRQRFTSGWTSAAPRARRRSSIRGERRVSARR